MSTEKIFSEIRNYLAGRALGITRDSAMLHEIVKCLFCIRNSHKLLTLEASPQVVSEAYRDAFAQIKNEFPNIFQQNEEILLDPQSILYVHTRLANIDYSVEIDPLSELYQTYVGTDLRGNEGQFFTPLEAVKFLVEAVDPKPGQRIIDPACGSGSFLSYAAHHLKQQGAKPNITATTLYGIEKDEYLLKLATTHLALSTGAASNLVCGDSIERVTLDGEEFPLPMDNSYDVVFANPPFGAKINIGSDEAKATFELAYKWRKNLKTGEYTKLDDLIKKPTPQVLFLELCLKLLKPGGKMGIVIPESLISSPSTGQVVQYLMSHAHLLAVVGMPEDLFKTSGKGGTHTKTCLIVAEKKKSIKSDDRMIFMAEAKWCGHDSRGTHIPHNDIPEILNNYRASNTEFREGRLGYHISPDSIRGTALAPRYYNPEPNYTLEKLSKTHDLIKIQTLIDNGTIAISTGDEVGKLAYGTGNIPFIRTSDLSNWELKTDPKHGVSEEIYGGVAKKQDVREGDILLVKDGTYLIGTCAYVSKYDEKIVYQSHLYKIRVLNPIVISPFLILAALSSKPVIAQIQARRFTQDIIDSLGKRINEIVLPIPKNKSKRSRIESMVEKSILDRIESRELARLAKTMIEETD